MADVELQPTTGDVLELILDDHRRFEEALRVCRRNDTDRDGARQALAELLVAHAVSEEEKVYPLLRRKRAISGHLEEHGQEEHADIIESLLAFLQAKGTDTQKYDDTLEELATAVNHHTNEEEQTILNPAREDISPAQRAELGASWVKRRNQLLAQGCASEAQVAKLLEEAVAKAVLAPEDARDRAEAIKAEAKDKAHDVKEAAKANASS
ncbi:MAG TPA: hemerythrin domain-containing protein [Ilumatobacter sp.]|nr:hemerythrin domain-containing protein [Ilumatobacter sp.]